MKKLCKDLFSQTFLTSNWFSFFKDFNLRKKNVKLYSLYIKFSNKRSLLLDFSSPLFHWQNFFEKLFSQTWPKFVKLAKSNAHENKFHYKLVVRKKKDHFIEWNLRYPFIIFNYSNSINKYNPGFWFSMKSQCSLVSNLLNQPIRFL